MPTKQNKQKQNKQAKQQRSPRVLVMESAGGAAANAVMRSGAIPLTVNPRNLTKLQEVLDANNFTAVLLTGGGDVDPRLYGEKPHKQVYGVSETRDQAELTVLDHAAHHRLPVMGICRGMQLIAVHNGGKLRQHIDGHRGGSHLVFGDSGSRFRRAIKGERGHFPSLHHQVVRRTGPGMRVGARSAEGHIEAIESTDGRILAVQFHPEYDYGTNEASRRLFDWLAGAAAKRAKLPRPKRLAVRRDPKPTNRYSTLPTPRTRPFESSLFGVGNRRAHSTAPLRGTGWFCRECGLLFDDQGDRDDHEFFVCGRVDEPVPVAAPQHRGRATEPPAGHPDWEPWPTRGPAPKRKARRS